MESTKGVPKPVQARAEATIATVIEATVEALESGNEADVRIDEILAKTGISKGSLYHHFGGREGLIAAARVVQFSRFVEADSEIIREQLTKTTTRDEFLAAVGQMTNLVNTVERQRARFSRFSAVSSAYGRPELWEALAYQQNKHTEAIADAIRYGQTHGWVRKDLDARAVSVFVQGYSLSRVLGDLDTDPISDEQWNAVVRAAISSFLIPAD
jgi:AcrR family transcriptional regulator